jgi:thiol-disulfide isomerase/thioredoxin
MIFFGVSILLTASLALLAAGVLLFRFARNRNGDSRYGFRTLGWLATVGGLGTAGVLVLAQLGGRFGPEHLWFRSPAYYVAAAIVIGGGAWWFTRSTPRGVRFGLPLVLCALLAGAFVLRRSDGHSAPLALLMPTMRAQAPDFTYVDATGASRRLSELKGDVVLINFWATWCAPCRREMPLLAKMQREYQPQRFRVLYLSLEEPDVLDGFLMANHFDGIQGRIAAAPTFYDAGKFYPLSYLVNRNGEVVARWSGRPGEAWLSSTIERQL